MNWTQLLISLGHLISAVAQVIEQGGQPTDAQLANQIENELNLLEGYRRDIAADMATLAAREQAELDAAVPPKAG